MRERKETSNAYPIAVDIDTLCRMTGLGRATATDVGRKSGAARKIGRRTIFVVEKVSAYLNALPEAPYESEDC